MPQDKKMLNQLLLAKKMSDQENYVAKYNLMNKLLKDHPDEFYVDQDHPEYPGIVHAPTGFRMHLPRQATYGIEKKAANRLSKLWKKGLLSDRAKNIWINKNDLSTPRSRLLDYLSHFSDPSQKFYGLKQADRLNFIKIFTSGRHKPKAGEIAFPAGFTGDEVASTNPLTRYLFRGTFKPSKKLDPSVFTSKFPDVSVNYALKRRGDNNFAGIHASTGRYDDRSLLSTNDSNHGLYDGRKPVINVYKQKGLDFRNQSSGNLTGPGIKNYDDYIKENLALRLPGNKKYIHSDAYTNPNYESMITGGKSKWVGSYDARQARGDDGMPVIALKRIAGADPATVVGDKPLTLMDKLRIMFSPTKL
jgi:hypothetical protein